MIIYLCVKFQSNTQIFSKDINGNHLCCIRDGQTGQDGMMGLKAADTICPPIENGGGIKKNLNYRREKEG